MYIIPEPELPEVTDISVYFVEDDKEYRETIQDLINETPGMFCLHTFASCEELFRKSRDIPLPEVLLLDINIPGKMSGIEGVRKYHKIASDVKIIMLTFHDDDDKIFNALCYGASGYLLKMTEPEEITEGIIEAHKGGAAMSRQIARRVLKMFRQFAPPRNDYNLSAREVEVLQHLVDGQTKRKIADTLFIAYTTVDSHIQNIYRKLHVHSATQAVRKAIEERLI